MFSKNLETVTGAIAKLLFAKTRQINRQLYGSFFHTIHFLDRSYLHSILRRGTMVINIVYFLSLHDVEIELPSNLERVTFR